MSRCCAAVLLWALAACAAPHRDDDAERLVVLHFNDLHGQVRPRAVTLRPGVTQPMGGIAGVFGYLDRERRATPARTAVWVTDGGDWFQGTPEGNEDRGWSYMAVRNRMRLRAAVVGNHEYDFGEDNLVRLIGRAEHPVLGANIRVAGGGIAPYVVPFTVESVGGIRVAIVGLITANTKNVSTGPFGRAEFVDEIDTLRRLWPELRRVADEVVLLTHCGLTKDVQLARAFPELCLILGGHSHTALLEGHREGRTWIVQSSGKSTAVSRVVLDVDRRSRRLVVRSAGLRRIPVAEADPDTARFLAATFAGIGPVWDVPLGRVEGVPDRRARGAPGSTPAGNYVAEVIRRHAGAEVGLTNKGGLRSILALGPITRRQVFELLPFDNSVALFEMTGAQLSAVLAHGLERGRQPLEVAGADYSFRVVDGVRQLVAVRVAGAPVEPNRRYRVATNSFLARGGDGFHVFAELTHREVSPDTLCAIVLTDLRERAVIRLTDEPRIRLVE
ncbi:MAG: bifunctional metallophosphatase/5'-nucleotidase [Planctomycetes bacterium]|nr:bifunctional metallophosphatase/5'-nucleotidase [Planctomycetota bacterium]